jgi:hypothetical protein
MWNPTSATLSNVRLAAPADSPSFLQRQRYGRIFLDSLPPYRLTHEITDVEAFFAESSKRTDFPKQKPLHQKVDK